MKSINEIVAESLMISISDVTDDLDFIKEPTWDSLAMLTLLAAVSDEMNVDLTEKEVKDSKNVRDLMNLIRTKRGE